MIGNIHRESHSVQ